MNDPKKPTEPQRTSQPNPDETRPMESPSQPGTEYEKNVPHSPEQPVAMTGKGGEGSYEGTREYREGYDKFSQKTSPEDAMKKAKQINPDEPSLKDAEQRGKSGRISQDGGTGGRFSTPSIH